MAWCVDLLYLRSSRQLALSLQELGVSVCKYSSTKQGAMDTCTYVATTALAHILLHRRVPTFKMCSVSAAQAKDMFHGLVRWMHEACNMKDWETAILASVKANVGEGCTYVPLHPCATSWMVGLLAGLGTEHRNDPDVVTAVRITRNIARPFFPCGGQKTK